MAGQPCKGQLSLCGEPGRTLGLESRPRRGTVELSPGGQGTEQKGWGERRQGQQIGGGRVEDPEERGSKRQAQAEACGNDVKPSKEVANQYFSTGGNIRVCYLKETE